MITYFVSIYIVPLTFYENMEKAVVSNVNNKGNSGRPSRLLIGGLIVYDWNRLTTPVLIQNYKSLKEN